MKALKYTTDPSEIAETVKENFSPKTDYALTLVIGKHLRGYEVGIAEKGLGGYIPTGIIVDISHYDRADEVLDRANRLLFPDRDERETMEIVVSSMGKEL